MLPLLKSKHLFLNIQTIKWAFYLVKAFGRDVCVNLCGFATFVPWQGYNASRCRFLIKG
jgi:hypothetical protein